MSAVVGQEEVHLSAALDRRNLIEESWQTSETGLGSCGFGKAFALADMEVAVLGMKGVCKVLSADATTEMLADDCGLTYAPMSRFVKEELLLAQEALLGRMMERLETVKRLSQREEAS